MRIDFERRDDELLVHLEGELDHHSAEGVRLKMDSAMNAPQVRKVYLNFDKVTFMDSSGVGVILGRYRKLNERKVALAIYGQSPRMQRILDLASLHRIIPICANLEAAQQALSGR